MDDPLVGSVIAGHRIVRLVGRGGMGVVYEAVELALDRTVALKVIAPELAADAEFRERFVAESRVAASIDHPNVVPIFQAGRDDDRLFLAMRFVPGDDLGTLVKRDGPLAPARAALIVAQVAAALDAAHDRQLVHRDVKPANVLVGAGDHAYLTDFGLAKSAGTNGRTRTGVVVGTPDYLAPDQIRGEPIGPWTDVYALGCVLFFALTGRAVFPLDTTEAKLWAHLSDRPPSVVALRDDVPAAFDDIVQAALAKRPEDRLASPAAFAAALRAVARQDAEGRVEAAATRAAATRRDWHEAESELAGTVVALTAAAESEPRRSSSYDPCPFKGLASFEFDDAAYFFGRERLVAELVARLVGAPLLGIVGASGSGKSSLLRAGLLPALAAGVLPGSERWPQVLMRPGEHPLDELERALAPVAGERQLVLAVDQFEETFTACRDERERARFLAALVDVRGVVIVAVRGDFYERCAAYPALSKLIAANHVLVAPMRRDELREVIERPAQRAGLRVEPELVDALLADVETEPGGLPLLSTALLELWQHRHGGWLQAATYERTGGVRKAVARLAEDAYAGLDAADQDVARRLLLRLAGEGAGDATVRQRVPLSALAYPEFERVAMLLAERRLLTISAGTVEVAHEALLREWPRLRGWLEQDAEGRRLHRRLTHAARDWDERGRDPGDLYRGARLAAALEWRAGHEGELDQTERDFLGSARDAEAHELIAAKRRARRLRALAAGLAALVLITGVSALLAVRQTQRVEAERRTAVSTSLATQAMLKHDEDPDVAALLSLEAYRTKPTFEARSAVLTVLPQLERSLGVLRGHRGFVGAVQFSPDGRTLASGGQDGVVRIWDARTRRELGPALRGRVGGDLPVRDVSFSPNGSNLLSGGFEGTVQLWDLRSHRTVGEPLAAAYLDVFRAGFSPHGDLIVGGTASGIVRVFDPRTRRELSHGQGPSTAHIFAQAFAPAGDTLATGGDDGSVWLWDLEARSIAGPALQRRGSAITALDFSPVGETLAAGDMDGIVRLWNPRTREVLGRLLPGAGGSVNDVAFAPDGKLLATAGGGGLIRLWDVQSRREVGRPLAGHTGAVLAVSFSVDGTLASAGQDGTVRLWDVGDRGALRGHEGAVTSVAYSADGKALASGGEDGTVRLWDPQTRRASTLTGAAGPVSSVAFAADVLAGGTDRGTLSFWDSQARRPLGGPVEPRVGPIQALAPGPQAGRLIVAGDNAILTWDTRARRETGPLMGGGDTGQITGVAVDRAGKLLVSAETDGDIVLWDASTGRSLGPPLTGHTLPANALALRPGTTTLASAGEDRLIRLWDTAAFRPIGQPLTGHTSPVTSMAFSRDGRTLASADRSGAVLLWDAATRRQLGGPLAGHTGAVTSLAFNPRGTTLASAGVDGTVRLWDSILWSDSLRALERRICPVVGRSFSRGEWREFLGDASYHATCP